MKNSLAVAGGSAVLPLFSVGQAGPSASSKLNVAFIGAGNIAKMAYEGVPNDNWVALCDVDSVYLDEAKEKYPQARGAKVFSDFRKMFDQMADEIDAVCVSTPDHTHYTATSWALEHGKHVCTQKPLTRTIWEARSLRSLAKEKGLVTNMANQGHTYDGIRRCREWLEAGVIGNVREVHSWEGGPSWGNRWFQKPESFPLEPEAVPATLDWDLWLGPRPAMEFSSYYHPLRWRSFWDIGTGMLGDWFCHTCDGPVWALSLYDVEYVELITKDLGNDPSMIPDRSVVRWHFGSRGGLPPCDLYWHDGGLKPNIPDNWSYGKVPQRGSIFYGDQLNLFLDERSNNPRLVNIDDMRNFRRGGEPPVKYPRVEFDGPFAEFIAAVKGDGPTPGSNFDYAARLTEVALLGVLAQRFGGRIEWSARQGKITNRPELNAYVKEEYRPGWSV